METLTTLIGDNPKEYFLEFSSKEDYLQKVQTWKSLYKLLSYAIRHNKKAHKATLRAQSLVQHRMIKAGKYWWATVHYAEYIKRRDAAFSRVAKPYLDEPYNPTYLLKIRGEMKVKSVRQMRGY
jgi:hypothetical protein